MSSTRVYNFAAGPSVLPLSVLERAGSEITNYRHVRDGDEPPVQGLYVHLSGDPG